MYAFRKSPLYTHVLKRIYFADPYWNGMTCHCSLCHSSRMNIIQFHVCLFNGQICMAIISSGAAAPNHSSKYKISADRQRKFNLKCYPCVIWRENIITSVTACKIHLSKTTADILTEIGGFVVRERDHFPDKVLSTLLILIGLSWCNTDEWPSPPECPMGQLCIRRELTQVLILRRNKEK